MKHRTKSVCGLIFAISLVGTAAFTPNQAKAAIPMPPLSCTDNHHTSTYLINNYYYYNNKYYYYNNMIQYKFDPGGFCLLSPTKSHMAIFQGDGNFVVYKLIDWSPTGRLSWTGWSSGTDSKTRNTLRLPLVATFAVQTDMNFVIYTKDDTAAWATNTYKGYPGTSGHKTPGHIQTMPTWANGAIMQMQDDGNLVVYAAYNGNAYGNYPVWASNTAGK
jgi:hypothetical protein